MDLARISFAGWAVATILVGAASTGCGKDNKASSPSSSASPSSPGSAASVPSTQPIDYSGLLIKPSDIIGDFTAPQPPVPNADGTTGVQQLFANSDNSRRINDAIVIVADPATAAAQLEDTKGNYGSKVTGAWQPAAVGFNGVLISGNSPDKSKAVTVLLFTEGKALVSMEFDGAPNDPIDPDVAQDIGRKQDAAIKNRLPS